MNVASKLQELVTQKKLVEIAGQFHANFQKQPGLVARIQRRMFVCRGGRFLSRRRSSAQKLLKSSAGRGITVHKAIETAVNNIVAGCDAYADVPDACVKYVRNFLADVALMGMRCVASELLVHHSTGPSYMTRLDVVCVRKEDPTQLVVIELKTTACTPFSKRATLVFDRFRIEDSLNTEHMIQAYAGHLMLNHLVTGTELRSVGAYVVYLTGVHNARMDITNTHYAWMQAKDVWPSCATAEDANDMVALFMNVPSDELDAAQKKKKKKPQAAASRRQRACVNKLADLDARVSKRRTVRKGVASGNV